jgi:hypothetical protein
MVGRGQLSVAPSGAWRGRAFWLTFVHAACGGNQMPP